MAQQESGSNVAVREASGALADYKPRGIVEIAQSRAIMTRLLTGIMKEGIDYGVIPGTPKPTLYKPGSEKILSTFMINAEPVVEDLSTADCIRYRVKVIGRTPDGTIIGYGIGECSTDEEKYRWRRIVHQKEWDATDPTMRREKFDKTGGAQKQVRTVPADTANTILKMAKKRAQIDMVLTCTAASDLMTQDLEDLKDIIDITEYQKPSGKPEVQQPQSTQQQSGGAPSGDAPKYDPNDKIKPGGAAIIRKKLDEKGIPHEAFCQYMKVQSIDDLLSGQMTPGMNAIKNGEIK